MAVKNKEKIYKLSLAAVLTALIFVISTKKVSATTSSAISGFFTIRKATSYIIL